MAEKAINVRLRAIVDQYRQGMQQAAGDTRRLSDSVADTVRRNEQHFTRLGIAAVAVGGAVTLMARQSVREFSQFESSVTRMTTLVGVAEDEARALGQAALGLGETGRGPQELARSLFFTTSAGMRGAAALDVVEASAKAAAIGLGDTATIADLVTSAVNAYGSANLSAAHATDVLVGTVREGKAEASELAGSMGRVLPIASNMGITLDQVGAAMAAMTRTGTNANEAATQLRAIMVSLLKPTQQSDAALRELGLSSEGLRRTIREDGLWQALQDVTTAVGDNDAAMARIFPNVRALAGVLDLTGANADETAAIFGSLSDVLGLTEEGFARWSQTTEAAMSRFSAASERVRIEFGEQIAPAFQAGLDAGTGFLDMLSDLPDPMQRVVGVGGSLAGAALLVAGGFALAVPRMLAAIDAARALNVTFASAGRAAMNPYVLALAAVIGQFAAFARKKAEVQDRVEAFRQTLDETTGAVTDLTNAMVLQRLQDDGAIASARTLGLSIETVRDAALGVPGAMDQVRAATDATVQSYKDGSGATRDHARAAFELLVSLGDLIPELGSAADEARELAFATLEADVGSRGAAASALRWAAAAERYGGAAGDAIGPTDDLGGAFGDLEDDIDGATSALDAHIERLNTMHDPTLRLRDATDRLADAQDSLADVQADADATASDLERALWALFEAEVAVEGAALKFSEGGGALTVETLQRMVREGRLTADEARILERAIGTLNGTADKFRGRYDAEFNTNEHQVRTQLDRINQRANNAARRRTMLIDVRVSSVDHRVAVTASGSQSGFVSVPVHTGGEIQGVGSVRRFHGGSDGPVGGMSPFGTLRHDEVPAILQTGEWVFSRRQVQALRDVFAGAMRMHDGGQVGGSSSAGGGPTVYQTFSADVSRQTMAEARHQQRLAYMESR